MTIREDNTAEARHGPDLNRRAFMRSAGAVALIGVGTITGLAVYAQEESPVPAILATELSALAYPHFSELATASSAASLFQSLTAKGVISAEGSLQHNRLAQLAQQEPLVAYQNFYYTPSELELYSLAWHVHPTQVL